MSRLKVYIAGPISKGNLAHNVNQASAAFLALARAGLAPFCLHWSVYAKPAEPMGDYHVRAIGTVNGAEGMSHADWLAVDLPWVAASDCLLRLPGESKGADLEEFEAVKWGIPVFHSVDEVIEWARGRG